METRGPLLIRNLDQILRSDPLIDELGLVPCVAPDALPLDCTSHSTPSPAPYDPTAFWVGEHKLAIALDAAKEMYSAALKMLKEVRREWGCSAGEEQLLLATQAIVVVNAEHYTAWNTRKRILMGVPAPAKYAPLELQLSALALSVHPKSEATWAHRRWVLRSFLQIATCPQNDIVQAESALAQRCAELRPMNYRAWSHRSWAARWMSPEQLRADLSASRVWVEQHVTDNCGLHYRRRLLMLLIYRTVHNEGSAAADDLRCSLIAEEQVWLTPIMDYYQGRESLWLHRRFLAQLSVPSAGRLSAPANSNPSSIGRNEFCTATLETPESEAANCTRKGNAQWPFRVWRPDDDLLEGGTDAEVEVPPGSCKWCIREESFVTEMEEKVRQSSRHEHAAARAQLMLAGRHRKWTRHFCHFLSKEWLSLSSSSALPG